jgi:LysM repeat protein
MAPAAATSSDLSPAAAVSVNIPAPAPVRYSPTRPGTPASEALENSPPSDVTPATTYTVVRGDSLSKIAKKNHTTVAELTRTNHLTNSSVLRVGQKLLIPGQAPTAMSAATGGLEAAAVGATYTVKPGDTLAVIAHRAGSTSAELKRLNNLRSDYVQVGRELKLPSGPAPAAMPEVTHAAPAAAAAGPASVKKPDGALTYEVKPGETVGAIARKFHVKSQDLLVANNIADPRKIRAGQNLVIPGGTAPAAASAAVTPIPSGPAGTAPAATSTDTSMSAATAPDLDSGLKPQNDVPVIKADDGNDTKSP